MPDGSAVNVDELYGPGDLQTIDGVTYVYYPIIHHYGGSGTAAFISYNTVTGLWSGDVPADYYECEVSAPDGQGRCSISVYKQVITKQSCDWSSSSGGAS